MTALTTMFNALIGWFLGFIVVLFGLEDFNLNPDSSFYPYFEQYFNGFSESFFEELPFEFSPLFLIPVGIFVIGAVIGLARRLIRG